MRTFRFFAVSVFVIITGCNSELTQEDRRMLSGTWVGRGMDHRMERRADSLYPRIELTITPDGSVHAVAGSAELHGASMQRSRGAVARFLGLETDFIIEGTLTGRVNLFDSVQYTGKQCTIPCNLVNDTLRGTFFVLEPWTYPLPVIPRFALVRMK